MIMKKIFILVLVCLMANMPFAVLAQNKKEILPGAYQTAQYLPLLKNKRVGLFTNHTATVGKKHLIDTLLASGIQIQKVFTPEHGLRGTADAGEKTKDGIDEATGVKIVSLYGKKYGPSEEDLKDVDVLLFDIQDVGSRFYTYISSLQYYMEAAWANNKPLVILDRPNPNGHYVDGPVLEKPFSSFVGKQSIPTVYGMTIGEYATMLVGEKWLTAPTDSSINKAGSPIQFTVIGCKNYDHSSMYTFNIAPSPNLPDMNAIYWYPTTCLIEGSVMSEGRGTAHAFAHIGHPSIQGKIFSFIPGPRTGAMNSKLYGQTCYGWDLSKQQAPNKIDLDLIIEMYQAFPVKDSFFIEPKSKLATDYFFNKLAGNATLMEQLKSGQSAASIRASWQPGLAAFKLMRKKYLLYKDFE
jgi:uncharacterized protein YbbC (DUF1343 family)